ncbi:MAG: MarR family winged helix-turn-helix transcriptional regulator [Pseudomonadota bacterium]
MTDLALDRPGETTPMSAKPPAHAAEARARIDRLHDRPGFLIRRLHQIHTALFAEECAGETVTPIMYSVLSALAELGPVDQTSLAQAVAIDKTNMADLLERLRKRGLIRRRTSTADRRVRIAALTEAGRALLDRIDAAVARAHRRTLEDLAPGEQAQMMAMMRRIIEAKTGSQSGPDSRTGPRDGTVGTAPAGTAGR